MKRQLELVFKNEEANFFTDCLARFVNGAAATLIGFIRAGVRILPPVFVPVMVKFVGGLYRLFGRKEVRNMHRNIDLIYQLPAHNPFAHLFVKQCISSQVSCLLESAKIIEDPSLWHLGGMNDFAARLQEAKKAGRGVIVITAHLGAWELMARATAEAFGEGIHVLAKANAIPAVNDLMRDLRLRMNAQVLWSHSKSLLRDSLNVLQKGGLLGFVMDQKPAHRMGSLQSFFGVETEFVNGPAALAVRTGAAVIAGFIVRKQPWRYRIIHSTIAPGGHGIENKDELTQTMVKQIETCIRLYPEQWTWNYKRWKINRDMPRAV